MLLYFDPGSGSIVLQMAIAAFTALVFFFVSIRSKIKTIFNEIVVFFRKKKNQ